MRLLFFGTFLLLTSIVFGQNTLSTWCNPLNLNYRFSYDGLGYREAADPIIHLYKGTYFLYASKSGGYWVSEDLLHWKFRPSKTLPTEDYAPTVVTIHDTAFFIASHGERNICLLYTSEAETVPV